MPPQSDQKLPPGSDHVVEQATRLNPKRYGRIPDSVGLDPDLTHAAVRVYWALSRSVFQGNTASIGQRLIAKLIHAKQETVSVALRELEMNGHIETRREGNRRPMYILLSPIFGQKQGKEEVLVSSPSGGQRLASVRKTA